MDRRRQTMTRSSEPPDFEDICTSNCVTIRVTATPRNGFQETAYLSSEKIDSALVGTGDHKEFENQVSSYVESELNAHPDYLGILILMDAGISSRFVDFVDSCARKIPADNEAPVYWRVNQDPGRPG